MPKQRNSPELAKAIEYSQKAADIRLQRRKEKGQLIKTPETGFDFKRKDTRFDEAARDSINKYNKKRVESSKKKSQPLVKGNNSARKAFEKST